MRGKSWLRSKSIGGKIHSCMRQIFSPLVVFGLLAWSAVVQAAPKSVFLAPPKVIGADEGVGVSAMAHLATFLGQQSDYQVITTEALKQILDHEKSKEIMGCEQDAACVAKATAATKTDLVIATTIGKVGKSYVLSMTLVQPKQAAPLARTSETIPRLGLLKESVHTAARSLLGLSGGKKKAAFVLPKGAKVSFAVLDLSPTGVSKEVADNLTQQLSAQIKRVEGASVVSRADLIAILSLEKLNQIMGEACDVSCVAELGGALGVDKLIGGSVGKLGESYFISLRLIDPATVRIDSRVTESFKGTEEQLLRAINHAGRTLLGLSVKKRGKMVVTASKEAAEVYIDNRKIGALPMPPIGALAAGRHSVRVVRSGYYDWQQDAYIDPGDTTALWAKLTPQPERWYEKWWLWTGVGAVVLGGVTAAIVVANQAPENGIVDVGVTTAATQP